MKFMNMISMYHPNWLNPIGSSGGAGSANSLSSILSMATELITWLITQMGAILNFITSNPLILSMFIITIAGLAVGMLFRIWHSVG